MGGFQAAPLLDPTQQQQVSSALAPVDPNAGKPGTTTQGLEDVASQRPSYDQIQSKMQSFAPDQSQADEQQQVKQQTMQLAPQIYQSQMPTGKGLKGMLQRFAYGFGQAAMHEAGLATDPELQAQSIQQAHIQAQTQLVQQQIQQMKTMQPVQFPNGTIGYYPAPIAAKLQGQLSGANARSDVAKTNFAGTALKAGYRINPQTNQPEQIPYDQLSEPEQAKIGVEQATQDLKSAMATGEPQKIQLATKALQARLQHQQAMEGVAQQNANANTTRAGVAAGKAAAGTGGATPDMKQLSPMAQKTIQETLPVHNQIRDLMQQFEGMKDDNTPAKFFADRAKYAAGMQSDIGTASDAIAQLELNRVVGAARVLRGSSRAIEAMRLAMKHLPNVWIDSPKLIYSKLANLDKAMGQIEDSAYENGAKNGMTANPHYSSGGGAMEEYVRDPVTKKLVLKTVPK